MNMRYSIKRPKIRNKKTVKTINNVKMNKVHICKRLYYDKITDLQILPISNAGGIL